MEKKCLNLETGFLFSETNFWRGVGSVLNVCGNYYEFNVSSSDDEADIKALSSDWYNIGKDIKIAKNKFEKLQSKETSEQVCIK